MKKVKFEDSKIDFLLPSWTDLQDLTFQLAKKIKVKKVKIDRLVTLAKGGWPMSRLLIDFLKLEKFASLGIRFYKGIDKKLSKPFIYQNIPVSIYKETVLLFDDVADSGFSLKFAKEYLENNGAKKIITATLFYKPTSSIEPDFWVFKTSSWIIFPYEIRESIELLFNEWKNKGLSFKEIKDRFLKLGFKNQVINEFLESSSVIGDKKILH